MKTGSRRPVTYGLFCLVLANATTCRDTPPPPEADSSPPASTTVSSDSLAITLDAPATLAAGPSATITIRLTNQTDRTLDLSLRGREIVCDLIVMTATSAADAHFRADDVADRDDENDQHHHGERVAHFLPFDLGQ